MDVNTLNIVVPKEPWRSFSAIISALFSKFWSSGLSTYSCFFSIFRIEANNVIAFNDQAVFTVIKKQMAIRSNLLENVAIQMKKERS